MIFRALHMSLVPLLKSAHSKPPGCFLTQKRVSSNRLSCKEKYGDHPTPCSSFRRHLFLSRGRHRPGCVHKQRVCPPSPARVSQARSFWAPGCPAGPVPVFATPARCWRHRHLLALLACEAPATTRRLSISLVLVVVTGKRGAHLRESQGGEEWGASGLLT